MQVQLWSGAAACVALATASGMAQWRRARRRDPDRVGWISWQTVQFAALFAAVLLAALALKGQ